MAQRCANRWKAVFWFAVGIVCCAVMIHFDSRRHPPAPIPTNSASTLQMNRYRRIVNGSCQSNYSNPPGLAAPECVRTKTSSPFQICIHPLAEDKFVSGSIKKVGAWEGDILKKIESLMEKAKPAIYLDIGANIGMHALHIASKGFKVVAVEPSPEHLRLLCRSISLNQFAIAPTVVPFGISNGRRKAIMGKSKDNAGHTYIIGNQAMGPEKPSNVKIEIETILLDDLKPFIEESIENETTSIVMKIDVESHECEALESADGFLRRYSVPYIFMEWLYAYTANVGCVRRMVNLLRWLEYDPFTVAGVAVNFGTLENQARNWGDILWKKRGK